MHTMVAQTDGSGRQPALGTFAGALTSASFPARGCPERKQLEARTGAERNISCNDERINMGIEFGADDRRFFREKVVRRIFRG